MDVPSMVQRSGDTLIVRSVVSGDQIYLDKETGKLIKNLPPPQSGPGLSTSAQLSSQQHQLLLENNCNSGGNLVSSRSIMNNNNYNNNNINNNNNNNNNRNYIRTNLTAAEMVKEIQDNIIRSSAANRLMMKGGNGASARGGNVVSGNDQGESGRNNTGGGGVRNGRNNSTGIPAEDGTNNESEELPQCKIKRNYSCNSCTFFTQNPRFFLKHLRDTHGEKIVINECKLCLYASRHYQKLVRHMRMVHGSTEGINDHTHTRRRQLGRERKRRNLDTTTPMENATINSRIDSTHVNGSLNLGQSPMNTGVVPPMIPPVNTNSTPIAIGEKAPDEQLKEGFQYQSQPQLDSLQQSQQQQQQQDQEIESQQQPEEVRQNRLLKCSLCDYTSLYRTQLIEHEQDEHCKTKFFRCEKCSYVTHIKARFSKHVKYHSMPMIKCVTCDFRTPYKWNLDRHMKNHGGAGPFKCAACNFTADIKQSLTVHEMNHHVPPVGHAAGMNMARRRNKVGSTDLTDDFISENGDLEDPFNNNNNIEDFDDPLLGKYSVYGDDEQPTDLSQKPTMENITANDSSNTNNRNNKSLNNGNGKKASRPIPNLIPIQARPNALNLSKSNTTSENENKLADIPALLKANSLKELAPLFFCEGKMLTDNMNGDKCNPPQLSPSSSTSSAASKRKYRANIFDRLKETFADAEAGKNDNLTCICGHVSKCLSESLIHQSTCQHVTADIDDSKHSSPSPINLSISGSTRCKFCRHRCKSSTDLANHIRNCAELGIGHGQNTDSLDSLSDCNDKRDANEMLMETEITCVDDSIGGNDNGGPMDIDMESSSNKHPMENKIFVWNKIPCEKNYSLQQQQKQHQLSSLSSLMLDHDNGSEIDDEKRNIMGGMGSHPGSISHSLKNGYYGVETAPGYGEVTKKMTSDEETAASSSLKKVYKCPHCSFWASTASRFHVHIVGHLNKKPFECSFCAYRSNWRWDITKHIRLKTIRDPLHKTARVLMNDETGRRNYTKYNKYITLMKVTEEDGDPKLMKSGEMTPNQQASLAFINEYANATLQRNKLSFESNEQHKNSNNNNNNDQKLLNIDNAIEASESKSSCIASNTSFLSSALNGDINHLKDDQDQKKDNGLSLAKANEDLLSQNVDINKGDGTEKRTSFKCRQCNYKNASREVVLAHVKGHYEEAGINLSPNSSSLSINPKLYINNVLAAMCLSQSQQPNFPEFDKNGKSQSQQNPFFPSSVAQHLSIGQLPGLIQPQQQQQQQQQQQSPQQSTISGNATVYNATAAAAAAATSANFVPLSLGMALKPIEHGEADEASSRVVTTSGSGVTGWRGPAPYRCGHCHQVSNWKHVIQRHCRLKHNGDIQIETLDRSCNRSTPVYRPLIIPCSSNNSNAGPTGSTTGTSSSNINNTIGSLQSISINSSTPIAQNNENENLANNSSSLKSSNIKPSEIATPAAAVSLNQQPCEELKNPPKEFTENDIVILDDSENNTGDDSFSRNQEQQLLLPKLNDLKSSNIAESAIDISSTYVPGGNSQLIPQKSKHQQCTSCPYVSESKSQMNYHISLHKYKSNLYECQICAYTCSKKQQLNQHMRNSHNAIINNNNNNNSSNSSNDNNNNSNSNNNNNNDKISFSNENINDIIEDGQIKSLHENEDCENGDDLMEKTRTNNDVKEEDEEDNQQEEKLSFCPQCPARFPNRKDLIAHVDLHGVNLQFKCKICSFSAKQETILLIHSAVHTESYQEKTEILWKKFSNKEDEKFRRPKITKSKFEKQNVWVVIKETESEDDHNDYSDIIDSSSEGRKLPAFNKDVTTEDDSKDNISDININNSLITTVGEGHNTRENEMNDGKDCGTLNNNNNRTENTRTSNLEKRQNESSTGDSTGEIPVEKCLHCPFQTNDSKEFKDHLQGHIKFSDDVSENEINSERENTNNRTDVENANSNRYKDLTCEHCTFCATDKKSLMDHVQIHFELIRNSKNIPFFVSYNNLKLNLVKSPKNNGDDENSLDENSGNTSSSNEENIYSSTDIQLSPTNVGGSNNTNRSSNNRTNRSDELQLKEITGIDNRTNNDDDEENEYCKKIVNINTGEVIKKIKKSHRFKNKRNQSSSAGEGRTEEENNGVGLAITAGNSISTKL